MAAYPGLFKRVYPERHGRNWIRVVSSEDLRAFISIGAEAHMHGHLGGIARASKAKRDQRGRFAKGGAR